MHSVSVGNRLSKTASLPCHRFLGLFLSIPHTFGPYYLVGEEILDNDPPCVSGPIHWPLCMIWARILFGAIFCCKGLRSGVYGLTRIRIIVNNCAAGLVCLRGN